MDEAVETITFANLYTEKYDYIALLTLPQTWKKGVLFERKAPRHASAVIYLKNCVGEYTAENGTSFTAKEGTVVCLPEGSRYSVLNVDCAEGKDDAIMCEFSLRGADGTKTFGNAPFILYDRCPSRLAELFHRSAELCLSPLRSPLATEISAKRILEFIAEDFSSQKAVPAYIEKGLSILCSDTAGELTIEEIAESCFVSSRLFRKKFKEYLGKSPVEFREDVQIDLIKNILSSGLHTVEDAAELLGLKNVPYVYRLFKKKTGMTPGEYRKKH